MKELEGKVAVVTGGAGGIGEAAVRSLSAEGAAVVISDLNWEGARKLEESLTAKGARALAVKTDVADLRQVQELAGKARSAFGRIDVLVNNAGIGSRKHPDGRKVNLWELTVDEWRRMVDVHLNGCFLCCREIVPLMIPHGWGRIINISSLAARSGGQVAGAHYAAAKTGILGLTRALAGEVGKYGITVNAITPGRIDTPIIRDVPPEVNAEIARRTPAGRLGTGQDIAGAILFLVSDAAAFVTGVTLDVNGGFGMF